MVSVPSRLTIVPCYLTQANAFVAARHRHHRPVVGARFCLAIGDTAGLVRGVAIVGRPVSRMIDDRWTAEVTRVCTDGCANACSALYGACWRAARAMGYRRLVTYLLPEEPGISVRAAGWVMTGLTDHRGRAFRSATRRRDPRYPVGAKQRWEIGVGGDPPPIPDFGGEAASGQIALDLEGV